MDNKIKKKIIHEISRLDKYILEAKPLLDLCQTKGPSFIELSALASVLHSFYNGFESISLLFIKYLGKNKPDDIKWHKSLLDIMFGDNSSNISLIREEIKQKIDNYRQFRHIIRFSYSFEYDWDEMKNLVINLEEI